MMPDLPKIEFKKDKVKYKITDIRFLNESALYCIDQILSRVCNDPDCTEVSFDVTGIEKSRLNLIVDIVSGISFDYTKGGRNGFSGGGRFLVVGGEYTKVGEQEGYKFSLAREHVKTIYEYAQGKESVSYFELVIAVAEKCHVESMDFLANEVERAVLDEPSTSD